MVTQEEVSTAIAQLKTYAKYLGKKELKVLPTILWEDELPEKAIYGSFNNGIGILVATNKRLIFLDKGMMSLKVEDFAYDKISSIQYSTGILSGEIVIYASGNKAMIQNATKDEVKAFADYTRARITGVSEHASMSPQMSNTNTSPQVTPMQAMQQLKELLAAGFINQVEYDAKKADILSRM